MSDIPEAGDIVIIEFNPQTGHEQAGKRPALVISPYNFNSVTGFTWVCPITKQAKGYPFEVNLEGTETTTGVILVDQLKSLGREAKNLHIVDKANDLCLTNVKQLIDTILKI